MAAAEFFQAFVVIGGAENFRIATVGPVTANAFKHRIAIVERLAVEVGLCLGSFYKLPVVPDDCMFVIVCHK